jgi:uncharacterized protein (TIGR00255 family)
MTGYGTGIYETDRFNVSVEVRSLNARFCDIRIKTPQQLAPLEQELKKRVLAKVLRGKIDVIIVVNGLEELDYEITINRPFISGYLEAFNQIRNEYGLEGEIHSSQVLQLPGVMDFKAKEKVYESKDIEAIMAALDSALNSLDEMRGQEGKAIQIDIASRIRNMEEKRKRIEEKSGSIPVQYKKNLETRIKEIEPEITLNPARLEQEVAFLADKNDVSEEVVRLKGHFEQMESLINQEGLIGKKIDFLLQEVNREANTINSKVGDLEICRAAIDIKMEAEKVREQIQNVE